MEIDHVAKSADGTMVRIRFGVWRCLICGEVYYGLDRPSHCPSCGVDGNFMVDPAIVAEDRDVVAALDARDRANLVETVRLEVGDIHYYSTMSRRGKEGDGYGDVRALYSALAKVETEHCEVFSRLLGSELPPDLTTEVAIGATWEASVAASSVRETTAHFVYSRFARETRNVRLKQVWTAIASVELEHVVLELTQLESGRFGLTQKI